MYYEYLNMQIYTNFLKNFLSVLDFSKGKIHFFSKVLKNWSSCQKTDYHFLGEGGLRSQSDKNHFIFLTLPLGKLQLSLHTYQTYKCECEHRIQFV